jgi:hypothetical protein
MKNGSKRITWKSYRVALKDIKPTPNNYKIKTALGQERLKHTLKNFGLAGTVICNWGGRFGDIHNVILIDGNSRVTEEREAGTTFIEVSLPDRVLTAQQYKEFSAMIDFAKAGEVDMERIEKEIGTTKSFYENYHLEPPVDLLNKLGANAPKGPKLKETETAAPPVETDERAVTLYFTIKNEAIFRKMEERLKAKFKTVSTSDTVFKAFKKLL